MNDRRPVSIVTFHNNWRLAMLACAAVFSLLVMPVGVQALPDLIVEDIWSVPSPLVQGEPHTFYARIRNVGTEATSLFVLSIDVGFLRSGVPIGQASHGRLFPGQDVTVSISAVAPSAGYHQFSAIADITDKIVESNETNNRRDEVWQVQTPPLPDFVVLGITTVPENPPAGSSFTAHITVRNSGTAPAGSSLTGLYLDGTLKGSVPVGPLAAGQQETVSGVFTAPNPLPAKISAKADDSNQVTESNENNNWYERNWLTTPPPPQPDLIIGGISFNPAQPTSGQPYSISIIVRNIGGGGAGASYVGLRLHGQFIGAVPVGPIDAGGQVVVNQSATAPSAGFYTLCARADEYNQVAESNEGNNDYCGPLFVLPPPLPDLVVTELYTVPAKPVRGNTYMIYARIQNQGAASVPLFSGFDTVFFVGGVNMGSVRYTPLFAPLEPGQSVLLSRSMMAPAAGSHAIIAHTDFLNEIQEQSEGNNTRSDSMTVLPVMHLQIGSVSGGGGFRIDWPNMPGYRYTVYRSATLNDEFLPIAQDLPNSQTHYEDTPPGNSAFYRVKAIEETP